MKKSRRSNGPGIYCIQNTINGMMYVGKALDINSRISHHRSLLRQGNHPNSSLQEDWNHYGGAFFKVRILKRVKLIDKSELQLLRTLKKEGLPLYNKIMPEG